MATLSLQTQHAAAPHIAPLSPHQSRLMEIIRERQLTAIFQPIVSMRDAAIIGYEGLIRGPSDSPLHSPLMLFQAARECGHAVEIEYLSRDVVLKHLRQAGCAGQTVPQCQSGYPAYGRLAQWRDLALYRRLRATA